MKYAPNCGKYTLGENSDFVYNFIWNFIIFISLLYYCIIYIYLNLEATKLSMTNL